jgi:hypothetical protein
MAGRYQGCHVLRDMDGGHRTVEVFWHHNGWFWRPCEPRGDAVGPFTTSTKAYESAKAPRHPQAPLRGSGLTSRARARG